MRTAKAIVALAAGVLLTGTCVARAQMAAVPPPPANQVHIFDESADANAKVAAAIKQARAQHKRVILDFGANWCGDCIVLDRNFHRPENEKLIRDHYVVVEINVGRFDVNEDIAKRYGVPYKKGIPALAVLDGSGKVLVAQSGGEFADMRHMDPNTVNQFLEKWKPSPARPVHPVPGA